MQTRTFIFRTVFIIIALALGGWTAFQQVGAVVAFGVSGPKAFPWKSETFEGAVYPVIVFWSVIYFLGLWLLKLFCREHKQRRILFIVAIFPFAISNSVIALNTRTPASFWLVSLVLPIALALAVFFFRKSSNYAVDAA